MNTLIHKRITLYFTTDDAFHAFRERCENFHEIKSGFGKFVKSLIDNLNQGNDNTILLSNKEHTIVLVFNQGSISKDDELPFSISMGYIKEDETGKIRILPYGRPVYIKFIGNICTEFEWQNGFISTERFVPMLMDEMAQNMIIFLAAKRSHELSMKSKSGL